jgi:hypothetical protein
MENFPNTYEFFVVMLKRDNLSPDLAKTNQRMYLLKRDAELALESYGDISSSFHVVPMIAMLATDWNMLITNIE